MMDDRLVAAQSWWMIYIVQWMVRPRLKPSGRLSGCGTGPKKIYQYVTSIRLSKLNGPILNPWNESAWTISLNTREVELNPFYYDIRVTILPRCFWSFLHLCWYDRRVQMVTSTESSIHRYWHSAQVVVSSHISSELMILCTNTNNTPKRDTVIKTRREHSKKNKGCRKGTTTPHHSASGIHHRWSPVCDQHSEPCPAAAARPHP